MRTLKIWNLKRYLLAYTLKSMPIVCILGLGIVLILFFPISFAENSSAWIGGYILAPILCIGVIRTMWKEAAFLRRQCRELEQEGKLDAVLEDYRTSEKTIGGNLRIGKKYLFGKGSMRLLKYTDISEIHMVNAERKGKLARDLCCKDVSGAEFVVCQLDPMGKSHGELDRVYRIILNRNPNAKTGL